MYQTTWPSTTAKSRVLLVQTERRILSRGMGASAGLSARGSVRPTLSWSGHGPAWAVAPIMGRSGSANDNTSGPEIEDEKLAHG
jgi:hypothetical protein